MVTNGDANGGSLKYGYPVLSYINGDNMYIIYKYTNMQNGKIYIGQTSNSLSQRAGSNGRNYFESKRFYNAIEKYGWSSFVPEIIWVANTLEEANYFEEMYINQLNSTNEDVGYNIQQGGNNKSISRDTALKISEMAKERYKDPTANPMYGRKHSIESIEKMRNAKVGTNNPQYGKTWNQNQRMRSGARGKKLHLSEERILELRNHAYKMGKSRKKPVICIDDNLEFDSATDAAKYYNRDVSSMCACLRGEQRTCCGKRFAYMNS